MVVVVGVLFLALVDWMEDDETSDLEILALETFDDLEIFDYLEIDLYVKKVV